MGADHRTRPLAPLVIMAAGLLLAIASRRITVVDDAWITFRYARNLAQRGELVFNAGERVEGITNLLWAVVLAAASAMLSTPIPVVATALALLLLAWTTVRLWQLGEGLGLTPLVATLPPLLLVSTPGYVATFTNGLEAPLYSACLVEVLYHHSRDRQRVALAAAGLLFLTRPEGAGVGCLLMTVVFLAHKMSRRGTRPLDAVAVAVFGGIVLCYFLPTGLLR